MLSEKPRCADLAVSLAKFVQLRRGSKEDVQSPSQLWEKWSRELGDINYVVVTPPGHSGNLPARGTLGKLSGLWFSAYAVLDAIEVTQEMQGPP